MFRLSDQAIEISASHPDNHKVGGVVHFYGYVRSINNNRAVKYLYYEAYQQLAIREGEQIIAQSLQQFDIQSAGAIHRTGDLQIGELAVWVWSMAEHRAAAFAATEYIIHEIKHRVPIWKKEFYTDGSVEWVRCQHQQGRQLNA